MFSKPEQAGADCYRDQAAPCVLNGSALDSSFKTGLCTLPLFRGLAAISSHFGAPVAGDNRVNPGCSSHGSCSAGTTGEHCPCTCQPGWFGMECCLELNDVIPKLRNVSGNIFTQSGNDIILIMAGGPSDWLENWVLNVRKAVPALLRHVLLIAMDNRAYQLSRTLGIQVSYKHKHACARMQMSREG